MKRIKVLLMSLILMLSMSFSVYAAPRVICDVTVMTDHSARVQVKFGDDTKGMNLRITTWRFVDENTLVVYYDYGVNVPTGFDSRLITHETYTFPMKVYLEAVENSVAEFSDLTEEDNAYGAIMNLYYRGIINGYPDGSFKKTNNVTRAEFAKMLLLSAAYELDADLSSSFSDVNESHWSRPYIMTLANKEILKGKGDGLFDPNGQITIGEVLTVLSRSFDLYGSGSSYSGSLSEHWSNPYFLDAVEEGIVLPSDSFYAPYTPNVKATREDCAKLLSRVLENLHDVAQ